jgi:hypothetical protein
MSTLLSLPIELIHIIADFLPTLDTLDFARAYRKWTRTIVVEKKWEEDIWRLTLRKDWETEVCILKALLDNKRLDYHPDDLAGEAYSIVMMPDYHFLLHLLSRPKFHLPQTTMVWDKARPGRGSAYPVLTPLNAFALKACEYGRKDTMIALAFDGETDLGFDSNCCLRAVCVRSRIVFDKEEEPKEADRLDIIKLLFDSEWVKNSKSIDAVQRSAIKEDFTSRTLLSTLMHCAFEKGSCFKEIGVCDICHYAPSDLRIAIWTRQLEGGWMIGADDIYAIFETGTTTEIAFLLDAWEERLHVLYHVDELNVHYIADVFNQPDWQLRKGRAPIIFSVPKIVAMRKELVGHIDPGYQPGVVKWLKTQK